MTNEQKITYMQMACGLCNFNIQIRELDLLVAMYELVIAKEGDTTISEAAKVRTEVNERYRDKIVIPNKTTNREVEP